MILAHLGRSVHYSRLMRLLDITPDLGAPASNVESLSVLNVSVKYRQVDLEGQIDAYRELRIVNYPLRLPGL